MVFYILISILLVIILLWIYIRFDNEINRYEIIKKQRVNNMIEWLYYTVNDICYECDVSPTYNIVETSQITYTDKIIKGHDSMGTIYLVVWNDKQNRVFNHNTLIYAILHEISHILSPSIHHNPPFDSIETTLLDKAIDLGYYNKNIPFESDYITLDIIYPT